MANLIYGRERATWILNHAGPFAFQRTRGQKMLAAIDDRVRGTAGVSYNAHVQGVTERWILRSQASRAAILESIVIVGTALIFPVAWPAGRLLYAWLARKVPHQLHTIPITALCWIGAALMAGFALVVDPADAGSLTGALVVPWILVQTAGTFLMAGMYGVLDGWLAVRGSTDWWPLPPPPLPSAPSLAADELPKPPQPHPGQSATPPLRHHPRDPQRRPWE